jgi:pyruvate formate lyase activating enzyme
MILPVVASATLHPAPPESYTVFTAGCNYKCLNKVLGFTTSITYDIKAFNDEVHLALTGASSGPVLRNAEAVGRHAKDQLWEYRILVIPNINEQEIAPLSRFIAGIDPRLPVCFLAFRPNFALEHRAGATVELMDRCVEIARSHGLSHAYWADQTGIPGSEPFPQNASASAYRSAGVQTAGALAFAAGCRTHPGNCVECASRQACAIKQYVPRINT